jgi:NAD-dependent dihydropyrimidine dehydrogenase PreA subunit
VTHVVTDNCEGCRFTDCVTVCPVSCFHGDGRESMAFFKMSRSIRNRLTSSQSWRSSSCSGGRWPLPGKAAWVLAVYSCFQRRSIFT